MVNASKECPRSGKPGKRKRRKAALSRAGGGGDVELEEREDTSEERPRYLAVTEPAIPSQEILSQMSALLLRIVTLPEGDDWVELAVNLIRGSDWEFQVEALRQDSLLQIGRRCQRAESVSWGANLVKMMAELCFAAKVNG